MLILVYFLKFPPNSGKGGNRARLVASPCYTNGGASSISPCSYLDSNHYNQLTPPGIDETLLERQLVSYIYENGTRDNPVTVPDLGEYCKKDLGFSMKGYLTRFLITHKHIFCLPDDGRQHVLLQSGAAEALRVVGSLPHLPEDLLGSSGNLHQDHNYRINDDNNNRRPVDYGRWDRITQEMYDFAISRGGSVPYKEVDVYIKARCAGEIAASGISLEHWQAQKHSWKRRNLFKKEGNCLVVHSEVRVSNGKREVNGNSLDSGGVGGESGEASFPPLPFTSAQYGKTTAAATTNGIALKFNAAHQALISERRALEKLQQEVRASLASIDVAAFSELQKENAGLRAACVTLGRELLAVKNELLDLKTQLAEHGINVANAVNLNDANGGFLDEIFLPSDLL